MSHRVPKSLLVFSDDWGRHPSSCQYLIRELLPDYNVLWVNTIGTRAPRLNIATFKRVGEKLKQWLGARKPEKDDSRQADDSLLTHENLTVVNPKMWPWFTRTFDRKLNARLLSRTLTPLIEALPGPVTAVTTLPITADLPGRLPVSQWLYYCVDDFGEWPGLDGGTLRSMDVDMIQRADSIIAVSETLQTKIAAEGRKASLLTHGVNLAHWQAEKANCADAGASTKSPLVVFWGVVDARLNSEMVTQLSRQLPDGKIMLAGPQQDPDPALLQLPNVDAPGPIPFADLPELAQKADVLIMPYADLPVTRAMQPLKMKEYLATGRPVVVSQLPATKDWADCMDVVTSPTEFTARVLERIESGIPAIQQTKRSRLANESWHAKARDLQAALNRSDDNFVPRTDDAEPTNASRRPANV